MFGNYSVKLIPWSHMEVLHTYNYENGKDMVSLLVIRYLLRRWSLDLLQRVS